jgi:hypothetical protein
MLLLFLSYSPEISTDAPIHIRRNPAREMAHHPICLVLQIVSSSYLESSTFIGVNFREDDS